MRIFETKWFHRWAVREGVTEAVLRAAVAELEQGLGDALGGYVIQETHRASGSRQTRWRTYTYCVPYRGGDVVFFMYGFPKNERANVDSNELKTLRLLARELLGYGTHDLAKAVAVGELLEVGENGKA